MVHSKKKKKNLKKKKKFLSHTLAMAAHIPHSHGDENHCLKRKNKKDENGPVIPSSLQCHYFALFQPNSSFFFFPCALLRSFILKQETLNCQKLHSSLRRHRAQPHSNSANRSSFPQPAGERGLSLLSHRSSSSSSSPPLSSVSSS